MFNTQVEMVLFDEMGSRPPLSRWHWLKHTRFNEENDGANNPCWTRVVYSTIKPRPGKLTYTKLSSSIN